MDPNTTTTELDVYGEYAPQEGGVESRLAEVGSQTWRGVYPAIRMSKDSTKFKVTIGVGDNVQELADLGARLHVIIVDFGDGKTLWPPGKPGQGRPVCTAPIGTRRGTYRWTTGSPWPGVLAQRYGAPIDGQDYGLPCDSCPWDRWESKRVWDPGNPTASESKAKACQDVSVLKVLVAVRGAPIPGTNPDDDLYYYTPLENLPFPFETFALNKGTNGKFLERVKGLYNAAAMKQHAATGGKRPLLLSQLVFRVTIALDEYKNPIATPVLAGKADPAGWKASCRPDILAPHLAEFQRLVDKEHATGGQGYAEGEYTAPTAGGTGDAEFPTGEDGYGEVPMSGDGVPM